MCGSVSCKKIKTLDINPQPDHENVTYPDEVEDYNFILGTQTIGPSYKHTSETMLVETAKQIKEMGSNVLKIALDATAYSDIAGFKYRSVQDLLANEPSFKEIMAMDFKYYFLWVYTPMVNRADGLSEQEKTDEYNAIYNVATYFLENFSGTGKRFFIGHWEGDWELLDNYNSNQEKVEQNRIQGMIDWLNIRQKAIDDAKANISHTDVDIFQYVEVNQVNAVISHPDWDRMINRVIPYVNVDYVSYSSYESVQNLTYNDLNVQLSSTLNFIEDKLPIKSSISGKRVFIGEYGFPLVATKNQQEQDRRSRMVMKSALTWGCPFILYWEMYNNEVESNGTQRGYWLIDNTDRRQVVYFTHQYFYEAMKKWVYDFKSENKRLPDDDEFRNQAVSFFN
jgi:hypothetical protein